MRTFNSTVFVYIVDEPAELEHGLVKKSSTTVRTGPRKSAAIYTNHKRQGYGKRRTAREANFPSGQTLPATNTSQPEFGRPGMEGTYTRHV